jgi:hypothetical protein
MIIFMTSFAEAAPRYDRNHDRADRSDIPDPSLLLAASAASAGARWGHPLSRSSKGVGGRDGANISAMNGSLNKARPSNKSSASSESSKNEIVSVSSSWIVGEGEAGLAGGRPQCEARSLGPDPASQYR